MRPLSITACGCVNGEGFGNARSWTPWPGSAPRLRWRTLSARPFDRFGRLDLLCKYAAAAVEMLGLTPLADGQARPDVALYLGTEHGSLDVDLKFCQSIGGPGGASPTLFTYTLPSTALGEIAIRHGISGPSLCLMAGPESGLLALWEGAKLVRSGEIARCICIAADAVESLSVAHAYAFLVEAGAEEGLATVSFTRAAFARAGGHWHDPLGRLFGFLAARDGTAPDSTLYLRAPATLRRRHAMAVLLTARRPNGRVG